MYTVRLCDMNDLPVVADFVTQFCEESYYQLEADLEKIIQTTTHFLSDDTRMERIVIGLEHDRHLVGIIAGLSQELMFSRDKVANEIMWWVLPEHRNRNGLKLLDLLETWARKIEAKNLYVSNVRSAIMERLTKLYIKRGYVLFEQSLMKVL